MSSFNEKYGFYKELIENSINSFIDEPEFKEKYVYDAMKYAMTNGGKRIRPILTLEFCRLCCGECERAIPFACAVEMIHCYSLVHDDLPCMDDDDFRRGKPSCHKAYGEANALLAGDGLLTLAFETVLNASNNGVLDESTCAKAGLELSKSAGYLGMIGGQTIDISSSGVQIDLETLNKMHSLKTGALIKSACVLGCIAGGADDRQLTAAIQYAECIGLAFQIIDDVLDAVGDKESLGKSIGKDAEQNKSTFLSFYSVEQSLALAKELTLDSKNALRAFGENADFLSELSDNLLIRKK